VREAYAEELDSLEADLQEEAAIARRALEGAVRLLDAWDATLAQWVERQVADAEVRYLRIERDAEQLFARQTPVATDLRLLIGALHVNRSVRRISRNTARMARFLEPIEGVGLPEPVAAIFRTAGARADRMLDIAFTARQRRELAGTLAIADMDAVLDQEILTALERIVELAADRSLRPWSVRAILLARGLERIGDHAVAVAEQTAYLLTGEYREFPRPMPSVDPGGPLASG
jgi:phosphate transport system protein